MKRWLWPGILGIAALAGLIAVMLLNRPAPAVSDNQSRPLPSSRDYVSLTDQADALTQSGSYPQAMQLLTAAIQLDPGKPQAYDMLAQLHLYVFGQLPSGIQNYQSAIAHGGLATFHVIHEHGGEKSAAGCKGRLSVSKSEVRYQAADSEHSFHAERSQVRHFQKNTEPQDADLHTFRVTLADGRTFNFAPTSKFTEAERDLILNIGGVE